MKSANDIIAKALAAGQMTLNEYDSKRILADYGIPTTQELLLEDLAAIEQAAEQIGYPLVLKVCAPSAQHKTEQKLLELGINEAAGLKKAYERLAPRARDLGGGILVQEMVKGSRELVIGLSRDDQFGPCVMFGLGGIFTEALGDVSFRVAPLNQQDAREMTTEIRGSKILEGIRGLEPVRIDQLSHCLQQLGQIGIDHPAVREIDINPLIIRDGRPVAVDALIVLQEPQLPAAADKFISGNLEKLFEPQVVAVIGASGTPHKAGNDVIQNILANEFEGNLYLVNPKGGEILGHKVYPSIQDLPQKIDLAIIILPATATPQAIRDCAAKGAKAIVMAASGFAEVDEQGQKLQQETIQAIRETGVRAIGPNTSGHTSTPHNFTSSFFPLGKVPRGHVSYLAQTGNFATHTMRYIISAEHFGVARVLGMGNKLDVEESEVLEYYGRDPETRPSSSTWKALKGPGAFWKWPASDASKPVILLKGEHRRRVPGGRGPHGRPGIGRPHYRGALRQAGVVRIYDYSHLILAAKAVSTMPLPRGNRVSFSAPSGAMLVCMTDLCHRRWGLQVPQFEEKTRRYLQEISPPYIRMRNPVDIWPAATVTGVEYAYREGTEAVLKDDNIDAVVMILMLTEETGVPPMDFIVELAKRYPAKPLYVTFTGQKQYMDAGKAFLEPRGVPTFPLIEEPFEVLSILARCRQALENIAH